MAVRVLDLVNRHDVRMVQRARPLRFLQEPPTTIGRRERSAGRTLIATSRPRRRVARAIHLAHPAGADEAPNLVRTKPRTG